MASSPPSVYQQEFCIFLVFPVLCLRGPPAAYSQAWGPHAPSCPLKANHKALGLVRKHGCLKGPSRCQGQRLRVFFGGGITPPPLRCFGIPQRHCLGTL